MLLTAAVAIGGAIGASLRYALGSWVQQASASLFPWGTFAVNVSGSFLFGVLAGLAVERPGLSPELRVFLLAGVLGGFTTFSSFSFETLQLLREGEPMAALVNSLGQVVLGLAAVWAGLAVARTL